MLPPARRVGYRVLTICDFSRRSFYNTAALEKWPEENSRVPWNVGPSNKSTGSRWSLLLTFSGDTSHWYQPGGAFPAVDGSFRNCKAKIRPATFQGLKFVFPAKIFLFYIQSSLVMILYVEKLSSMCAQDLHSKQFRRWCLSFDYLYRIHKSTDEFPLDCGEYSSLIIKIETNELLANMARCCPIVPSICIILTYARNAHFNPTNDIESHSNCRQSFY